MRQWVESTQAELDVLDALGESVDRYLEQPVASGLWPAGSRERHVIDGGVGAGY